MKQILFFFFLFICVSMVFAQQEFASRKGSKLFPGHFDIVVTVDNEQVRYELFNHWYTGSYEELRQMTIHLDSLDLFNSKNDVTIQILDNKVLVSDATYGIKKQIGHKKGCASVDAMRKISYAHSLVKGHDIRHYELYTKEDLNLPETEFRAKVVETVKQRTGAH